MVMYALQDYIGEDKVNAAIREFLKQYAFKGPPYPTSLDLEAYFRKVTPPQYQYLFDDLFRNITIYDNRALSADYVRRPDGKYQVNLMVGVEEVSRRQPRPGARHPGERLDRHRRARYRRKVSLPAEAEDDQEKTDITVTVDKLPAQAGIDPVDKLIDRNPDDNVIAVKKR